MFCHKITFVIFTYNEEARIERVVRNFRDVGKVLVVDNLSSDNTCEIAGAAGALVIQHKNPGWVEDEKTVAVVKTAVNTEWIYWGFADEMVDFYTLNEIVRLIASAKYSAINIVKKNYYLGVFCNEVVSARLSRIFKKDAIDFTGNKIHYFGKIIVPIEKIYYLPEQFFVHHFMSYNAKSHSDSYNRYTDLECEIGKHSKPIGLQLILAKALKRFVYNYFFRGGIKAGRAATYLIIYTIWYDILRDMKLYEANKKLNLLQIEREYGVVKDNILNEFNTNRND